MQGGSDSAFCFALFLNQLERYDLPLDANELRQKLEMVVIQLNEVSSGWENVVGLFFLLCRGERQVHARGRGRAYVT